MGELSSTEFLVGFLLAASAGTAVFFHAERNRIKHPSAWATAVTFFLAIGLPLYLLQVRRIRKSRAT